MYPPQRAGVRATTIPRPRAAAASRSGRPRGRRRCTARKYAERGADVRRRLRQLRRSPRPTSSRCSASSRSGSSHRATRARARSRGRRARGRPRRPLRPHGLGTLEPRKNLAGARRGVRLLGGDLGLVVAGGEGWGEQPRARRPAHPPARLSSPTSELARLYRGAAVVVYPSRSRASACRSSRRWRAARPSSSPPHPSLDEACGDAAVRVDPLDPEAIAAAIREALARREELVPRGLVHASRFSWRGTGATILAALEERA